MVIKAKKRFGQNFITDKNLLKKIVDIANIKDKCVLEIGPGMGALTQFLVKDASKYLAYEIDTDLKETLALYHTEYAYFIFNDFLKQDVKQQLKDYFEQDEVHLVGNLPYYITSPIVFKFLEIEQLKTATMMVQKEVGNRMAAKPNSKNYNGLSVILQYYTNVSQSLNVNRKMFYPIPKVDSVIIKLEKKETTLSKQLEEKFIQIVKSGFSHKRKMMINNLTEGLAIEKSILEKAFNENKISLTARAESITVDDFIALTQSIY